MTNQYRHKAFFFDTLQEAALALSEFVRREAEERIVKEGIFSIVLPGGKTPKILFETLAKEPFASKLPWDKIHVFWGDERCIPEQSPLSNYNLAYENLISKITIPPANIHRIRAELEISEASADYDRQIEDFFHNSYSPPSPKKTKTAPTFDLIILGVGPDGHTASIFPGSSALREKSWTTAVQETPTEPYIPRITLTLPAINSARRAVFFTSINKKEKIINEILEDKEKAAKIYPAAMISTKNTPLWFIAKDK